MWIPLSLALKKIETLNPTAEKSSYDVTRRNETRRFNTNFSLEKPDTFYTSFVIIINLASLSPFAFLLSLCETERQRETERDRERQRDNVFFSGSEGRTEASV